MPRHYRSRLAPWRQDEAWRKKLLEDEAKERRTAEEADRKRVRML
jgi:hypothetical protein